MSGATAAPLQADAAAGADAGVDTEPAERGSLIVADRVVERIAGHAVTMVDGALAAPRRVLGISVGKSRPSKDAHVDARVDGSTATVEVTIAVCWPVSVRTVADDVRSQIRGEVSRIAAVTVDHVDIDVIDMSAATRPVRRVR